MKLQLITILVLLLNMGQAQKWQWGPQAAAGLSGDRAKDVNSSFTLVGGNTTNNLEEVLFEPSFWIGAWAERQLGEHFSLTLALQYHWLNHIKRFTSSTINTRAGLIATQVNEDQLRQSALEVPLGLRYYFQRSTRSWRIFLGGQLIPLWINKGSARTYIFQDNIFNPEPSVYISEYNLSFEEAYVQNKPIQLGYSAELGFSKGAISLALVQQWSFRPEQLDYYDQYICRGGCDFYDPNYNPFFQSRLLKSTNLRLQYRIN